MHRPNYTFIFIYSDGKRTQLEGDWKNEGFKYFDSNPLIVKMVILEPRRKFAYKITGTYIK